MLSLVSLSGHLHLPLFAARVLPACVTSTVVPLVALCDYLSSRERPPNDRGWPLVPLRLATARRTRNIVSSCIHGFWSALVQGQNSKRVLDSRCDTSDGGPRRKPVVYLAVRRRALLSDKTQDPPSSLLQMLTRSTSTRTRSSIHRLGRDQTHALSSSFGFRDSDACELASILRGT
ncbi:hypothetical protein B0H19DRAFT_63649 [Mycena capillaripes]|nr:hypothetical protein B0H19DRAFT_63649 [Mycena capillaripes]